MVEITYEHDDIMLFFHYDGFGLVGVLRKEFALGVGVHREVLISEASSVNFEFDDKNPITRGAEDLLRPDDSLAMELCRSAVYSGAQSPVNAVVQLVDRGAGTHILPKVQFIDPCAKAEFLSARWHTQQIGSLFGTTVNLLVLQKAVGWAGNELFGHIENSAANQALLAGRSIREAAVAGFVHNAVFRPVTESEGDFFEARLRNGLVGAGSWATSTAVGLGIKRLGMAQDNVIGAVLRSDVGSTVISGIPSGIVSAELRSVIDGKGWADGRSVAEAVYNQSIVGAMWAGGKEIIGGTRADTHLRDHMKHASFIARGKLVPPDLLGRTGPPVFALPTPAGAPYKNMSDFPMRER